MKHYCITGGIGAGKSYVCKLLGDHGIEIYDCDSAAKRLMNGSPELRRDITALIGSDAYAEGRLNKPVVAQFLLASEANKVALNAIVHPAVMQDFRASGMQWMESAILYDAHLEAHVDAVVAVVAPDDIRTERIMRRDGITRDKAREWIASQMPQEEVARRADFIITNDGKSDLDTAVQGVLETLQRQERQDKGPEL